MTITSRRLLGGSTRTRRVAAAAAVASLAVSPAIATASRADASSSASAKASTVHAQRWVEPSAMRRTTRPLVRIGTTKSTNASGNASAGTIVDLIGALPLLNFLKPKNVFAADVSKAPINANSDKLVANLANQVTSLYNGVAAFNVWNYNVGFATATTSTPRQRVIWDNCQKKTYTPAQLYTTAGGAAFVDVPIPAGAAPAAGTDAELAVWDPVRDKLWEFWRANKQADGWHACWGGRIDNWSTSSGYFPNGTGATATGLAVSAGVISIKEAQSESINHAMTLAIPRVAHWSTFSYPAQRSDGGEPLSTPNAIAEGLRFRLDPRVDVSKLKLTPVARAVAVAAQKYGFIISDKSGAVAVQTESGQSTAAVTGTDPWRTILGKTPAYEVMRNFPWDKMQALPFDYGKP